MAKQIDFWTLLKLTQEYVSQHYAAVLTDKNKLGQLKAYVDKYLRDNDYHVENLTTKELIDKLYCEMAEYSVLTPFLPVDATPALHFQDQKSRCMSCSHINSISSRIFTQTVFFFLDSSSCNSVRRSTLNIDSKNSFIKKKPPILTKGLIRSIILRITNPGG